MIPAFACPAVMTPGQFGPTSRIDVRRTSESARIMSTVGMPSVMHTASASPASAASMMASAPPGGGTKITDAFAPVSATAFATVSNTGHPSWRVPPLPGVTPPTTFVPYACAAFA
jgi:hypothetical protein